MTLPRGWFYDNGCLLVEPSDLLPAVYAAENGDPCRRCNCKDECPAWRKLQRPDGRLREAGQQPRCGRCGSPLNMAKVERRGWRCACGAEVKR